ncbi:MAG TPA: hypothetical protein VFP63_03575 [Dehalococcoidia bacterium]|nr:hypothetical protein [Dehalococcoidia bacterium]
MDPGGIGHIFRFKDSWLTFDANGWIVSDGIMPADEGFYATTLDELHQAGSPAVVNGKQVRVPRGVSYHPPVLNKNLTEGWLGPPEEAPELHVFKRGTSVLSFEADGTLVADKVAAEDEWDFSALRQELSSAANE